MSCDSEALKLLKNDRVKNKNSITDATKDDCCHMLRLQVFTFKPPLLRLYERSIPYPIWRHD